MRSSPVIALVILAFAARTVVPAVPTKPLAGQTPQQEDRDARECAEAEKPKGAPSYEACMISRRYQVAHHVIGSYGFHAFDYQPEIDLTINTEAIQPRTAEQVAADIEACRAQVRARGTKAVMGYAEPNRILKLAKYYADCMEPRGYKTTLWEPKR